MDDRKVGKLVNKTLHQQGSSEFDLPFIELVM
jgi:hypothetical protein